MNSRERLLASIACQEPDHAPLLCWCFGFNPPPHLRWQRDGRAVTHWYSLRLEHIHTLPQPWTLADDIARVERWLSLGLDDVLEVSPPWGLDPAVRVHDWREPPTAADPYPRLGREYQTPAGALRHIVRQTAEVAAPGWVVQPSQVALFEDYNIPRGVRHAVVGPADLAPLRYLLQPPAPAQLAAYRERMQHTQRLAREHGVLVQGWSAFGMDGVVWLMGVEGAILAAVSELAFFQQVVDTIAAWDRARTTLMLEVGGVDVVVQRGWYSSVEFWSPALFRRFVLPHLRALADLVHQAGRKFAYAMTVGVLPLADELLQAGLDLLCYVDPVQDRAPLPAVKARLGGRICLAGGINSGVTLARGTAAEIRQAVYDAHEALAAGGGFILSPVDALFPDTPWESVQTLIAAWREVSGQGSGRASG